jgi:hypothetical protein
MRAIIECFHSTAKVEALFVAKEYTCEDERDAD